MRIYLSLHNSWAKLSIIVSTASNNTAHVQASSSSTLPFHSIRTRKSKFSRSICGIFAEDYLTQEIPGCCRLLGDLPR